MAEKFEEPPELFDSSGEKIVVFRNPDGTHFSNHPEYNFALAMHQQKQKEAADAEEVEDDEPQEPDNNDGTVTYEEMTSHDLAALAKERNLELTDRKRSTVIAALQADDEARAAKAGA